MTSAHPLERFWSLLLDGNVDGLAALIEPEGSWDDPLFDGAKGQSVKATAIPRLASWVQGRTLGKSVQHLRTTADAKRVVVEDVLRLKDGLVWNQEASRSEKAAEFDLAVAVVGDRSASSPGSYRSVRVYFSTWAVLDGASRLRVGPICPDERPAAKEAIDALPTVRKYFDRLATGDASIIELFEPDGYFREPANNFACGRDQLALHFRQILELGGVGIDFLTATREGERIGIELQTVLWGTKKMPEPQAGFACYELGPNGLVQGSRVYDSVVPPAFA
jgi:hypothetical protein